MSAAILALTACVIWTLHGQALELVKVEKR